MDSFEYVQLAMRTCSFQYNHHLVNPQAFHSAIGLVTEAGELMLSGEDKTNIVEEIGDLKWYLAIGYDAIRVGMQNNHHNWEGNGDDPESMVMAISIQASEFLDLFKKALFYGSAPEDQKILVMLDCINGMVNDLIDMLNLTQYDVMVANISKLKKRFPDKFTSDKAMNRDLAEERKAIEGETE